MIQKCHFHPVYDAVATTVRVDLDSPSYGPHGEHLQAQYKRVPICFGCYSQYKNVNTARVEKLEGIEFWEQESV